MSVLFKVTQLTKIIPIITLTILGSCGKTASLVAQSPSPTKVTTAPGTADQSTNDKSVFTAPEISTESSTNSATSQTKSDTSVTSSQTSSQTQDSTSNVTAISISSQSCETRNMSNGDLCSAGYTLIGLGYLSGSLHGKCCPILDQDGKSVTLSTPVSPYTVRQGYANQNNTWSFNISCNSSVGAIPVQFSPPSYPGHHADLKCSKLFANKVEVPLAMETDFPGYPNNYFVIGEGSVQECQPGASISQFESWSNPQQKLDHMRCGLLKVSSFSGKKE